MSSSAADRRARGWALFAVLSLLVALGLRLWGIEFSGGDPRGRPDEEIFITTAFGYFSHLDPRVMLGGGWPEGFFRICHWVMAAEHRLFSVAWGHDVNLACAYAIDPLSIDLGLRLVSALCGTLACLFVGLTARRLASVELRGAAFGLGILALGCNYLAARDAHFGVSDATLLLCIAASLHFAVRAVQGSPGATTGLMPAKPSPSAGWLVVAAAWAGAGFGIKYAAAPLLAPCLVAGVGCLALGKGRRLGILVWGVLAVAAALGGFLALSPHALKYLPDFWRGLTGHRFRFDDGSRGFLLDPTAVVPPGWRFHLAVTLPSAFGWAGLSLAFAGVLGLAASRRVRWPGLVLLSSALASFAFLIPIRALFVRYASPMLPALAVGLALVPIWAYEWARRRGLGEVAPALATALALVAFVPSTSRLVAFDRLLARPDTRDQASEWIVAHGPGTTLVPQGGYAYVHVVQQTVVDACRPVLPPWLWHDLPILPGRSVDWAEAVRGGPARWHDLSNEVINRYLNWSAPPPQTARFVTQARSVLACGKYGNTNGYTSLDPHCFEKEVVFDPGKPACGSYVDLFDSFFVPFADFEGQTYSGPEVTVFENRCLGAPRPPPTIARPLMARPRR